MTTKPRKPVEPVEPALTNQDIADDLQSCTKTVRRRITAGETPVVRSGRLIHSPEDHKRFHVRHRHG